MPAVGSWRDRLQGALLPAGERGAVLVARLEHAAVNERSAHEPDSATGMRIALRDVERPMGDRDPPAEQSA